MQTFGQVLSLRRRAPRNAQSGLRNHGERGVQQGKRNSGLALATAILLLHACPSSAANAEMVVQEFGNTCIASKSVKDLKTALAKGGWNIFASLSQSHLEREIDAVTPMLDAQGLSSDYIIYGRDEGGQHLELALSETKKPINGGRKLIGCSIYDFDATSPVDSATVKAFAPTIVGQKSVIGDVQVEKWNNIFGEGSGMRAVFVPAASTMSAQLGFSGMMLGTHFLDTAE